MIFELKKQIDKKRTHTKLHEQLASFWGLEQAFSALNLLHSQKYWAKGPMKNQDHHAGPAQISLAHFLCNTSRRRNKEREISYN